MGKSYVLTFIAEDRPGLVEKLSEAVTAEGGNWLESRMAHLAKKFAGIARVDIPSDKASSFEKAFMALEAGGFRLTIEETSEDASSGGSVFALDMVGPDHPGIVRDITRCLAEHGASVEEMTTDVREAPMGGGLLFYAEARVRSPAGVDAAELRQAIEGLSAALMVDITMRGENSDPG